MADLLWHLRFTRGPLEIGVGKRPESRALDGLPWTYRVWQANEVIGRAVFLGRRVGVYWVRARAA